MTLIIKSPTALKSPKYPAIPAVESLPLAGYTNRWNAESLALTAGANISNLPNVVSGPWGSFIQPDAAQQPTLAVEGGFKNVSITASHSLVAPTFTTTGPKTMVVVGKILSGTNVPLVASAGSTWNVGASGSRFIMNAGTSINGPLLDTAWHVFIAVFDGANSVFSVDGVEYAGNAGTNQPTGLRMGGGTVAGGVRDVAIYMSALSQADRQALTASLKKKYGL